MNNERPIKRKVYINGKSKLVTVGLRSSKESEEFKKYKQEVGRRLLVSDVKEKHPDVDFSNMSDLEVCRWHFKFHKDKRNEKNKKYKFTFGKYKGRKITSMVSKEEIDYCRWFILTVDQSKTDGLTVRGQTLRRAKNNDCRYRAIKWWINLSDEERKQIL